LDRQLLVGSDRKHGRYYYWSDNPRKKMYSVSTICHWNDEPIKAGDAAKIGTLGHYVVLNGIAKKYLGVNLDIPGENPYWTGLEEVSQKLDDVVMMWQQLELEKVVVGWEAIEAAVWWEGELDGVVCAYAGRLDGVANFCDGKRRLVDIKTGDEYDSYLLQMAAYVQAYEFVTGLNVDEVWILYLDVGGYWNNDTKVYTPRNVDRNPRVVVMDRPLLEDKMVEFNGILKSIYEEMA
jgi:hypothetical protein